MEHKYLKKTLSLCLVVLLTILLIPLSFAESVVNHSGYCGGEGNGTNLSWENSNGTLTIRGTGKMKEPNEYSPSALFHDEYFNRVVIENGVTSISAYAFAWCDQHLTEVIISDTVTEIGSYAFYNCEQLQRVEIGNSVSKIGKASFKYCFSLMQIVVNPQNQHFASDSIGCLYDKSFQTLIQFPTGSSCASFTVPNTVKTISACAFYMCQNLNNVLISSGVETIEDQAFYASESLESVTLSSTVSLIGYEAFVFCPNLHTITIPKSVVEIGTSAFAYCSSLRRISVDNDNSFYSSDESGCLYNKDGTTLIQYPSGNPRSEFTIPEHVTKIGFDSFSDSIFLESITIPKTVEEIDAKAFYWCTALKNIELPLIKNIMQFTFAYCEALESVVIPYSVKYIDGSAFDGCKLTDIYYLSCESNWNKISIGENDSGTQQMIANATIHFANGQFEHEHVTSDIHKENFSENYYYLGNCVEESTYDAVYYCLICGYEIHRETIIVPPTGHYYSDWTYDEDNHIRWRKCFLCNDLETETLNNDPADPSTPLTEEPTTHNQDDQPSNNQNTSFFQRIIEWFRNLFDKLFGWMKR